MARAKFSEMVGPGTEHGGRRQKGQGFRPEILGWLIGPGDNLPVAHEVEHPQKFEATYAAVTGRSGLRSSALRTFQSVHGRPERVRVAFPGKLTGYSGSRAAGSAIWLPWPMGKDLEGLEDEVKSLRSQVRRLEAGLDKVRRSLADVERIANEALDEAKRPKRDARRR